MRITDDRYTRDRLRLNAVAQETSVPYSGRSVFAEPGLAEDDPGRALAGK